MVVSHPMSEQFQLVFSGEVLDGQHPAVVKKRLANLLKLDDNKIGVLFSGNSVVVKKSVDKATAAKYLAAFKKSGASLLVKPLVSSVAEPGAQPAADVPTPSTSSDASMDVLPSGSDLLSADERPQTETVQVNTDHLQVDEVGADLIDAAQDSTPAVTVEVDHISLADVGETLGEETTKVAAVEVDDNLFDVAEVGSAMGELERIVEPAIDMDAVSFDVAEVGATLDTSEKTETPKSPTTDHIQLSDD